MNEAQEGSGKTVERLKTRAEREWELMERVCSIAGDELMIILNFAAPSLTQNQKALLEALRELREFRAR